MTWDQLDRIVLHSDSATRPARLLVTPASDVDLAALPACPDPLDGGTCRLLLDLGTVRESPDEVAKALVRHAGDRFVDARSPATYAGDGGAEFSVVLRGYDPALVDDLIGRAGAALASAAPQQCAAVAASIGATALPVTLRGYDRFQVDAHLGRLADQLTAVAGEGS